MTRFHRLTALAGLVALSGCAATGATLDRTADRVEARSNCHNSAGEFVPMPSCAVSYSVSNTTTTTTTSTTTTAAPGQTSPSDAADDQA